MQRLLYISTAREALDDRALDGLLRLSRRNNAAVGVTGLLVVGGRRFLQALEGPSGAVEQVFQRIARDPRHRAIVMLSRTTIDKRVFGGWAMGYRPAQIVEPDTTSLADIVAQLVRSIDDDGLRAEFASFATLHAAA